MAHSACATYVKAALIVFHLLCLMVGAFTTYLGLRGINQADTLDTRFITYLILGGVILVLALLGFLGSFCESAPLLYIYGGGMFLVLLGTFPIIFMGPHNEARLKSVLEAAIQNGLRKFNDKAVARTLQYTQCDFECCGWNGPDDYKPILGIGRVPVSCCGKKTFQENGKAQETCELKDIVYGTACKSPSTVTKYASKMKTANLIIAFTVLTLLFMTYFLAHDVGKKSTLKNADSVCCKLAIRSHGFDGEIKKDITTPMQ